MNDHMVGLGGQRRMLRVLIAAGVLLALALPWQAAAQIPTPMGEIPIPTTLPPVLDDGDGGGGITPPPVTTPPTTTPTPPTTVPPNEQPRVGVVPESEPVSSRTPATSKRRASSSRPADATAPDGTTIVERAVADGPRRPAIARLRAVSVPAARQFGFPLVLGVFVLAFLVVQARLDARDPKLAAAPVTVDDDLLPFL